MCDNDDEVYADDLSNVCDHISDSDGEESDSGSDIIVRRMTNLMRPVIGDDDEKNNSSDEEEWSRKDIIVEVPNCETKSGVQIQLDDLNIQSFFSRRRFNGTIGKRN